MNEQHQKQHAHPISSTGLSDPCQIFSGYSSAAAAEPGFGTTPDDSGSYCGCPRHGGEAGKHLVALHTAVFLESVPSTLAQA